MSSQLLTLLILSLQGAGPQERLSHRQQDRGVASRGLGSFSRMGGSVQVQEVDLASSIGFHSPSLNQRQRPSCRAPSGKAGDG